MSNFHTLEVVGLCSETQLRVDENLNFIMWGYCVDPKCIKR